MTGGSGTDIFAYDSRGFGADTITDFSAGDKIDLRGINVGDLDSIKPYVTQVGDDVILSTFFGGSLERITIQNATLANVLASIQAQPGCRSAHDFRHDQRRRAVRRTRPGPHLCRQRR